MKQISARAAVGRGIQGDLEDQPLASNVAPPHWLREAQRVHMVNQANQVTQSNCSKLIGISWVWDQCPVAAREAPVSSCCSAKWILTVVFGQTHCHRLLPLCSIVFDCMKCQQVRVKLDREQWNIVHKP